MKNKKEIIKGLKESLLSSAILITSFMVYFFQFSIFCIILKLMPSLVYSISTWRIGAIMILFIAPAILTKKVLEKILLKVL